MVKSVRKVPKYGIVPCIAPYKDKDSIHAAAQHACLTSPLFFLSAGRPHHLFLKLQSLVCPLLVLLGTALQAGEL